ncbi:glycosyltransferase family 2 protein [Alteromonas sp. P256]|uniref:glycosyltransferase family 2 protein n=1 Tax=Alteromonas sp. P256 TaxID=3117399 RepID=UPI002FE0BC5C
MNKSVTVLNLLEKVKKYGQDFGALGYLLNHYTKENLLQQAESVLNGFEPKVAKYINIETLAYELCRGPLAQEKKNLLKYMDGLRFVQMSETYLNQVKSFAINFTNLDKDEKNHFAKHVRNAFMLSQDEELLEVVRANHSSVLSMLSIPTKISNNLTKFSSADFSQKEQINNVIFDNFDNKDFLRNLNLDSYHHLQHKFGLGLNKARLENRENYLTALNGLLSHYNLSKVVSLELNDNVLDSLVFERPSNKRGPLVSVIMSCFNSEKTVGYAIRSLLNQSYQDIEILVCDDKSDDESLNIIKSLALIDKRVRVFSSKDNQGTYNIRNALIPLCKGEYITFQDADDVAIPHRIERQIVDLEFSDSLVTSCRWIRISPEGELIFFPDGLINRFCVVSTMVKKEVFSILPKFRQSLVAADTEFHELCLFMLGAENVRVIDEPLILGLWGDGSLTKRPGLAAENTGSVAPRRRAYSDIAARQRVIGSQIISDEDVDNVLREQGIYREYCGVEIEGEPI